MGAEREETTEETTEETVVEIAETAPTLPWEIALHNSMTWFQKTPDGGMILKFAPVTATPNGPAVLTPAIAVLFSEVGWERFKEQVAADGEKPIVETASVIPAGLRTPRT